MKTAVEFLIQQLVELDKQLDGRRKNDDATVIKLNPTKIYEQAKEMEEKEKVEMFIEGYKQRAEANDLIFDNISRMYAISLYNETFNK